eukprot:3738526-Amphidinium_carterae.1
MANKSSCFNSNLVQKEDLLLVASCFKQCRGARCGTVLCSMPCGHRQYATARQPHCNSSAVDAPLGPQR